MEIVKAHTRASDLKIPEVLPPATTPLLKFAIGSDVAITESATQHESIANPCSTMFNGSLAVDAQYTYPITSGALVLNARYEGWSLVGIRYLSGTATKYMDIMTMRVQYLSGGSWITLATISWTNTANDNFYSLMDLAHKITSARTYRIVAVDNFWGGSPYVQWREIEFVVGHA